MHNAIDCAPNLSSLQIMEENDNKSNVFISLFSFIFLRYLAVSVMGKQRTYLHIITQGNALEESFYAWPRFMWGPLLFW